MIIPNWTFICIRAQKHDRRKRKRACMHANMFSFTGMPSDRGKNTFDTIYRNFDISIYRKFVSSMYQNFDISTNQKFVVSINRKFDISIYRKFVLSIYRKFNVSTYRKLVLSIYRKFDISKVRHFDYRKLVIFRY